MKRAMVLLLAISACSSLEDAGGEPYQELVDPDDPLSFEEDLDPESFDALHREVILPSCAAVEAFCHYGQFEPNLSTPALAYESLVRRPGIELFDRYRVTPGDPSRSLIIDKLRDRSGVATMMPLGAPPMAEEDIARIEKWISDGARRHPDAPEAAPMNEPPLPPEIAVYDDTGSRIDVGGVATVKVGDTITLRHSAMDYETADPDVPFAAFSVILADGRNVYWGPTYGVAISSSYDAAGPMGNGDALNFRFDWTVPATVDISADGATVDETISTAGQTFSLVAYYLDGDQPSILTFGVVINGLVVQEGT